MNAATLYPEYKDGDYGPSEYEPIIESIQGEILLRVDDDDYQGDSRVLYRDGDRYGWLQFGWGSCSGCDALQGVDTVAELDELIEHIRSSVRWFESRDEALVFFRDHDWRGDYTWGGEEQKRFVSEAMEILSA